MVAARPRERGTSPIRLTRAHVLINHRIALEALRRVNSMEAWLDAGVVARDLCGGSCAPSAFHGVTFGTAGSTVAPQVTSPRPVVPARPVPAASSSAAPMRLTPARILNDRRISESALRRANALALRLDNRLTGGDLHDGAVTARALEPGTRVTTVTVVTPVPATNTEAVPSRGSGGRLTFTVAQRRDQRVAQAVIRCGNALVDRLMRGLSGVDFQASSLTGADLAPELTPAP